MSVTPESGGASKGFRSETGSVGVAGAEHVLDEAENVLDETGNVLEEAGDIVRKGAVHWLMVGDSHIRNIFDSLLGRLPNNRLQYHMSSFPQGVWHNIEELFATRRKTIHGKTLHVRHQDLPIHLTYYWDPLLDRLPAILHPFIHHHTPPPQLILTGGALHFIKNNTRVHNTLGDAAALGMYRAHLTYLASLLSQLHPHVKVVFKMVDHIEGRPRDNLNRRETLDQYNLVACEVFGASGGGGGGSGGGCGGGGSSGSSDVALWDSTLPLSENYVAACQKNRRHDVKRWWACKDQTHVGGVVIQEYVEMLLNYMCTPLLHPQLHC